MSLENSTWPIHILVGKPSSFLSYFTLLFLVFVKVGYNGKEGILGGQNSWFCQKYKKCKWAGAENEWRKGTGWIFQCDSEWCT